MTEQQAAYLAGAIAHANDSLDWIEHRQGPLPDDGYARIETSVGVVRALAGRETTVGNEWGIGPLPVALIERQSLKAENARLRERVAALAVLADHVEDAWQDEGVNGDGFVFNLNWFLSVARGEELSPYLKDRAALDGQPAAGGA